MAEFDCPDVTQCGWQDVKIQLLTNINKLISKVTPLILVQKTQLYDLCVYYHRISVWTSLYFGHIYPPPTPPCVFIVLFNFL